MDILGLVWTASLLNQSASPTPAIAPTGHPLAAEANLGNADVSTWFVSLAEVYGWEQDDLRPTALFSTYASLQSWLLPTPSTLAVLPDPGPVFPHGSLTPGVSTGLTSFEPAAPAGRPTVSSVAAPTPSTAIGPTAGTLDSPSEGADWGLTNWNQWDAIAAVRIVAPQGETTAIATSPPDLTASQCLDAPEVPYPAEPIALSAAAPLQIWVHNRYLGEVRGQVSAQRIARKLRSRLEAGDLQADDIRPLFGQNFAAVSANNDILLVVDDTLRPHPELPAAAVAVQWVNNLRIALRGEPLDLAQVQMAVQGLRPTGETLVGTASWYGPGFHGRKTANGERFNQNALTAAHKTLPFGTQLRIRNRLNGKTVVVRINDRGPYVGQRALDLSRAAAQCLGAEQQGVIPFEAEMLEAAPESDLEGLLTAALDR
jgi:hypothetical protein